MKICVLRDIKSLIQNDIVGSRKADFKGTDDFTKISI